MALWSGDIDGHETKLWPGEGVVEVVLEEVVLGEVLEVGVLDEGEVVGGEEADIHCGWLRWDALWLEVETVFVEGRKKWESLSCRRRILVMMVQTPARCSPTTEEDSNWGPLRPAVTAFSAAPVRHRWSWPRGRVLYEAFNSQEKKIHINIPGLSIYDCF